jgi:hypothetical protein
MAAELLGGLGVVVLAVVVPAVGASVLCAGVVVLP